MFSDAFPNLPGCIKFSFQLEGETPWSYRGAGGEGGSLVPLSHPKNGLNLPVGLERLAQARLDLEFLRLELEDFTKACRRFGDKRGKFGDTRG